MRSYSIVLKFGLAAWVLMAVSAPVTAEAGMGHNPLTGLFSLNSTLGQISCGEEFLSLSLYENISLYSLIIGFVLVFSAIFLEQKKVKLSLSIAAILPFLA